MRSKINKFMFFNFEKEENWLNEMAAKGIEFVDYTFYKYQFEEGVPGRYTYRIEFLENKVSHPESIHYIKFLEEAGIECISAVGQRLYMRKKSSEGPFEVYSDLEARLKQYTKIRNFTGTIVTLSTIVVMINTLLMIIKDVIPHLNIAAGSTIFAIGFLPTFTSYAKKVRALKNEMKVRE
ncbi:MAG: DUF2812 domain-containing protein [Clostridia bacterium]|nr:DUF2812 domain-containing protein [Clostridia bacterium]